MKKASLVLLCLSVFTVVNIIHSQNTLVYFRYDIIPDDMGKIISLLDSVKNETNGRFVLYYDNQDYDSDKYYDLVYSKDFLSYTNIYEPEIEEVKFSQLSAGLLCDTLIGTEIKGTSDKSWKYIFVLSDFAQKKELVRLITANSLQKRLRDIQFIIYDDRSSYRKVTFGQLVDNNEITAFDFN